MLRAGLLALYLAIGLVVGGRYVAPGALPADSGELQLVARELGVAHPPGYPLYTLAAHGFGRLVVPNTGPGVWLGFWLEPLLGGPCPELFAAERNAGPTEDVYGIPSCLGDPVGGWWTWSTNLFSLVLALLTLLVVYHAGRRLGGSWTAGVLAAAILMAMPVFVQQATIANIRMPTALLTAAVIALALRWLDATHGGEPPPRETRGLVGLLGDTRLYGLALALGLAASHHVSLVFLAPVVVCVLIVRRPWLLAPRQLRPLVLAGALGLLPLLYLPIRGAAGALLAPPDLTTLGGFWRHVTGANFRGDLRLFDDPIALWDRTLVVMDLFTLQLGWPGLLLVAIGSLWLIARRRSAAWLLLGIVLTYAALAIWYRAPQTVEYLMPAHVAMAVLASAAGSAILSFREHALVSSPPLRRAAVIALGLAIAAQSLGTAREVRAGHPPISDVVWSTIPSKDCATPVLANWHYATPLWLEQHVGQHVMPFGWGPISAPRSETSYVYPEGAEPIGETWRRRAEEATFATGAAILTNRTREIMAADMALWPVKGTPFWSTAPDPCGVEARPRADRSENDHPLRSQLWGFLPPDILRLGERSVTWPEDTAPIFTPPSDHERRGALRLVAAERPDRTARAAVRHELTLSFEAVEPLDGPATVVAQLIDPETGAVHGQFDRGFSAARANDPRGLAMRADLHRFRGPLPDRLAVHVGIYHVEGGEALRWDAAGGVGEDKTRQSVRVSAAAAPSAIVLREWSNEADQTPDGKPVVIVGDRGTLPPPIERPLTSPPSGAIPFGDAMTLLESNVRRRDDSLRVDLTWRAERAYRSDYTISVQATAEGGFFAQHDGTPAVGAYPTLKWLPGQRVRDRHRIALPEGWPTDVPTRVSVGIYDAFSLEPLPVTDAERVRDGQGQRATLLEAILP